MGFTTQTGPQTHTIIHMKIYVGNLTEKVTTDQIRDLFATHGEIQDVYFVNDKATGKPRGFGFVLMPDAAHASAAMKALNGFELDGQALAVNEPKAKKKSDPGPPKRGSRPSRPPGGHSRGHRLRR